jgi:hydrogenase/urease accessory protein HupE
VRLCIICLALIAQAWIVCVAQAHELRPAFLDMKEIASDQFAVVWKVPAIGDQRLALDVQLPDNCSEKTQPVAALEDYYLITRWTTFCADGLRGRDIGVSGLRTTLTDVLARIGYVDGTSEVARLTPENITFTVTGVMSLPDAAATYFLIGVQHILSGIDHLLFVLGLMLLVRDRWMLVKTISAFTVAHSITLGLATFRYVHIPAPPLNAAIALSILFVGLESVRSLRGETSLAIRHPWLVAFLFGLLHGIGFASGLISLGLPHGDIPLALLTFNAGVEVGQLMFVTVILLLQRAFRLMEIRWPWPLQYAPVYALGTSAAFWTIDRIVAMVGGTA